MAEVTPSLTLSNRILSKLQISLRSCSHMNCCLQNTLHINLHILYFIHFKTNSKIHELWESHKYIKSYQETMIEFLEELDFYFNII